LTSPGRSFLLEVGCEEIPAGAIEAALSDLGARLLAELGGPEGLGGAIASPPRFGGPRRLVALIEGIRDKEPDRVVQVMGPPVAAAYDAQGRPTKAALGFAKAQGVEIEELEKVRGEKGEVVAARRKVAGRRASELLAQACPRVLSAMRFPKMMKWGNKGYSFVRPVHWIVALLDQDVVEFEFMGIRSGRATHGHRFLSPGPHPIQGASEYETILRDRGQVIARIEKRRERIQDQRGRVAGPRGWTVAEDEALLREVVFLNEHPSVISGELPPELLDLPEPVLVTAMKHHQKYFPVREKSGSLAPGFLAVINLEEDRGGVIRRGNEWVLKARLEDARFFWNEDRKRSLQERTPALARVTFLERLGSVQSRVERLERLCAEMAGAAGLAADDRESVRVAARLCKADLTTGMVGEFPELQGVMGGIYARAEGLPESVARAIEEHYRPTSADGPCPTTRLGSLLALADKIDLLAGCFSSGLLPKGSADPYGLRRAAQGVCRILLSETMAQASGRISLKSLVASSLRTYSDQKILGRSEAGAEGALRDFLAQRQRFLMEEAGMKIDTARAVLASGSDDPADAWLRARALTGLRGPHHEADFESLATSAKRIRNILAQAREKGTRLDGTAVDPKRLVDREEGELHRAVTKVTASIEPQIASGDYASALKAIASLRPEVDRFFDKVLVMSPDEGLRVNRLALLGTLSGLLSRVADFSEIVVEGAPTERRG